jgi:hypothetical protein
MACGRLIGPPLARRLLGLRGSDLWGVTAEVMGLEIKPRFLSDRNHIAILLGPVRRGGWIRTPVPLLPRQIRPLIETD